MYRLRSSKSKQKRNKELFSSPVIPRLKSYQGQNLGKQTASKLVHDFVKLIRTAFVTVPHTHIPFLLILIGLGWLGAATVVALFYENSEWAETEVWRWCVWIASALIGLPLIALPFSLLKTIISVGMYASQLYYYFTGMGDSLTILTWVIIVWIIKPFVLEGISGSANDVVSRVLTCILVLVTTYLFVVICVKISIARARRNAFWKSVKGILRKERIIYKLAFHCIPVVPDVEEDLESEEEGELRRASLVSSKIENKSMLPKIHKLAYGSFFSAWEFVKQSSQQNTFFRYEEGRQPKNEAKTVASMIFSKLRKPDMEYLALEDFVPLFSTREKAIEAFKLIDPGNVEEVSLLGLEVALQGIFTGKQSLHKMLTDRESIAAVVRAFCVGVWFIIMIPVILIIFGVDLEKWILTFGTFFLGFSFVFSNTAKKLFENILLIFIVRPYDVGDRITFGTYPTLIVSAVKLLTTEAFAPDGRQFIIPNDVVLANVVTQYHRSTNYAVTIDIIVDAHTPMETVQLLKERVLNWMKEDKTPWKVALPTDWLFYTKLVENNNKMSIGIWVQLDGINWSKPGFYLKPTSALYMAVQKFCKELHLEYRLPPQTIRLQPTPKGIVSYGTSESVEDEVM